MQGDPGPLMEMKMRSNSVAAGTIGLATWVVLLLQACTGHSTAQTPPAERTIPLAGGGKVTVVREISQGTAGERVSVFDQRGEKMSESWCSPEAGSYDELVRLFSQLQKAVAAGDRPAVARLMSYPLAVNGGSRETINSAAALLKSYTRVFTPAVSRRITQSSPQAVFCNWQGATFADGVVWANAFGNRTKKIGVVNR